MKCRISLLSLFVLTLSACGERIVIQKVNVPVSIPCITEMPQEPKYVTDNWVSGQDIWKQSMLLLAERQQRIADQNVLRAAIGGCIKK